MNFSFLSAGRIVFGAGEAKRLHVHLPAALLAEQLKGPALVVTGASPQRAAPVLQQLTALGIEHAIVTVPSEPSVADAERATLMGRQLQARFVLSCGGGSAIDLGKAAAALLANPGAPLDYLEVVGAGQALQNAALPCVAIPTTSGTGAEVTKNAVINASEQRVKVSLRHDSMLPALALVDPELTLSVSPAVTAATGLDALTQCIEPYISCMANPVTDSLSRTGIIHAARSLRRAYVDGNDLQARTDMSLCSLLGGLALANAKLGAVHGFAGTLGGMLAAPHGAICARLLAPSLLCNLRALQQREADNPALGKLDELGRLLTGTPTAKALDGIEWIAALVEDLSIPRLSAYALDASSVATVVQGARRSSSMKGNPIELSEAELHWIVQQSM